jgi:hypothetical protein
VIFSRVKIVSRDGRGVTIEDVVKRHLQPGERRFISSHSQPGQEPRATGDLANSIWFSTEHSARDYINATPGLTEVT